MIKLILVTGHRIKVRPVIMHSMLVTWTLLQVLLKHFSFNLLSNPTKEVLLFHFADKETKVSRG